MQGEGHKAGFSARIFYLHGRSQREIHTRRETLPGLGEVCRAEDASPAVRAVRPHGAEQRGIGEPPAAGQSRSEPRPQPRGTSCLRSSRGKQ